jgi:hypothetical protein
MEMRKGKFKTRLAIFLAIFVVVIMSAGAFAGAAQQSTSVSVSSTVPSNIDVAGEPDNGKLSDLEVGSIGSDAGSSSTVPDLDTQEELAAKILGEDGLAGGPAYRQPMNRDQNLYTYKSVLSEAVNSFVERNSQSNGASVADVDSGSGYTSNLYDTVSNYLKNGKVGYETYMNELIADGYTPDREIVEERTVDAKVFRNDDGTMTAVLNQEPIHYKDAMGNWQDIDLNLKMTPSGDYQVIENNLKSYFDGDSSVVKIDTTGDNWFKWTPYEQRYMDKYGLEHELSSAQDSDGKVSGNVITYENSFTDTTEEYIIQGGNLKHNLILSEFPDSAVNGLYLSYVGKIELAEGLAMYVEGIEVNSDLETRSSIEVRDSNGDVVYYIPPPVTFEYDNMIESVMGSYSIQFMDGEIYLSMNTPIDWLIEPGRNYPIVVDPNIFTTLNAAKVGYAYEYYYYRKYHNSNVPTINQYWYCYYLPNYPLYYPYIGSYGYAYNYTTYYYTYQYTRRAWMIWNTSVIDDSYTIKQIDFHGKEWRTYNIYSTSGYKMTVNIRDAPLDPNDYPYDYTQNGKGQKNEKFFKSLAAGDIYNTSVDFGIGYNSDVDVYALGGKATINMENNLTNDFFRVAMHRAVEMPIAYPGYGYFYTYNNGRNAQLYVTYDPCPMPPIVDTGGPYSIPEGTTGVYLDASATVVCGTSATYKWDIGADGSWDITATSPTTLWNKFFPDDWVTKIKLQVKDLTLGLTSEDTTTFTVYNVHPQIVTPSTPIIGYEGQTTTLPRIEFTDPGADVWKYYYDFDNDGKIDNSGSTIDVGGKHYVPSVKWYWCDDTGGSVDLTVEDEDGGYSDDVEQEKKEADYDGYLLKYKRPANPANDYYYKYLYYNSYTTMLVYYYTYLTSSDSEYRGIAKFEIPKAMPSTFKPTSVTLRTYVSQVYESGKVGVNDITSDPDTASALNLFKDADDSNIMKTGSYFDVTTTGYKYIELDPQDFIDERKSHGAWYAIGLDRYDKNDDTVQIYFYGGSYTTLTLTDGTNSYTLKCYTGSNNNRNGLHGYVYHYWYPARDELLRYEGSTSSILYLYDYYYSYYDATYDSRLFIKFDKPTAPLSKIVGGDLDVYVGYMYGGSEMKVGTTDLDADPETSTDTALWTDIQSSSIAPEWEPRGQSYHHIIDLNDADVVAKYTAHNDWYGVGMKKNSGDVDYLYIYSSYYKGMYDYAPKLLIDYRVPYKLAVNIKNIDPVLDLTNMKVSPTDIKEGDPVSVTGIEYSDAGPCDSHQYRVVVPLGTGKAPMVVVDWTDVSGGKFDFKFEAPDDDPDDADADISKDTIKVQIEVRDDDYVPDFHYKAVQLELVHYGYTYYSWKSDWGVYQNLKPWDEMRETWKSYPRSYSKSTPEATVAKHSATNTYHTDIWDITSITKKWMAGTEDNYGLRIMPTSFKKDPNYITSSDYYTASYRPILRVVPTELMTPDWVYQPDGSEGKDTNLRKAYYENYNFGSSSTLIYSYDYPGVDLYGYYQDSEGLIEFDLSSMPPETDEGGIARTTFGLTISNVDPVLDESAYKILDSAGNEVSTIKEGDPFMVTDIIFKDPAAGYETEVFEYQMDWGNSSLTPWTKAATVTPGGSVVTPNEYENSDAPSYTSSYFGYYYYDNKRYMQWIDSSEFGGEAKLIKEMQWRPTYYAYYKQYEWTAKFGDLKIYMSHKSDGLSGTSFASN